LAEREKANRLTRRCVEFISSENHIDSIFNGPEYGSFKEHIDALLGEKFYMENKLKIQQRLEEKERLEKLREELKIEEEKQAPKNDFLSKFLQLLRGGPNIAPEDLGLDFGAGGFNFADLLNHPGDYPDDEPLNDGDIDDGFIDGGEDIDEEHIEDGEVPGNHSDDSVDVD